MFSTISQEGFNQALSIVSVTKTNETCNYSNNGTININVTGGTKPYTYSLWKPPLFLTSPSTNDTTYSFTDLEAGLYQITVADQDTFVTSVISITQPAAISISSETVTPVSCKGADDGIITIVAAGGNGGYTYTLLPGGILNGTGIFSNLTPDTYTVSVVDSEGCGPVVSSNLVVTEPLELTLSSLVSSDITCNNNNDGAINISVSGGNAPLTYTLVQDGSSNITGIFSSLSANTYTIEVVDSKGCPGYTSPPVTIINPPLISITSQTSVNVTCNGLNDGSISVSALGGTGTLTYTILPGGSSNITGNFNNLSPASYTVSVTDVNSCPVASTTPIIISEPAPIVINTQIATDISCFANNDGEITVSASGGTGTLQYTLNPGLITNTSGTFLNLSNNTYTVSVTDSLSCAPVSSIPLVINRPAAISMVSYNFTDISCNNVNDGLINVIGAGGTGTLTYTLTPGGTLNTTGSFNSLSQGVYTVEINDANSCPPVTTPSITITNPSPVAITNESFTDITCTGLTNGTITITATGGTGLKHFTINPGGATNVTGNFTGLNQGNYLISVTDDNSCPPDVSSPITISEPGLIVITSESATDITCFANTDGTVSVSATGGTGTLQYTLIPGGTINTTGLFTGLSNGTYTVSVSDANNCGPTVSNPLVVNRPAVISLVSSSFQQIKCNGNNDGEIHVSGSGGTSPLLYTLNPVGTNNITGDFTSLSPGVYTVSISDAKGCPAILTSPVTITDPPVISIISQLSSNISCNGTNDGSISVTAGGGTGALQYTLNPPSLSQPTGNFSGLSAGIYTVSVTDAYACPAATTTPINIIEPAIISVTVDGTSILNLNCFNNNDGKIDITVSGGTPPFLFSWTGPSGYTASTEDINSLIAGSYNLSITDSKSCSKIIPNIAVISEPPPLTFTYVKTDITCNGLANGTVTITASGGTPSYNYSKNGITYQGSPIFNGLTKNTYTFYVKDSNNCIQTQSISIDEPFVLQITSEIRIDNNKCFGDSLGEIRILAVTGGVAPYQYSINGGVNFYPTSDFQHLPAGTYQSVVKDANGCIDNGNLNVINQPAKIYISSYAQLDISGCYGNTNGQIAIEASGGTGTKTYTLDTTISNTTGNFINLGGGLHNINISDINSCSKDTAVLLNQPLVLIFDNITLTNVTGCSGDSNGSISAIASGGAGSFLFSLNGGIFQPSGNFSGLAAATYTLSLKDANNCQRDTLVTITEPAAISIINSSVTNATCNGFSDGSITIAITGGTSPFTFTLNPGGIETNSTGIFNNLPAGNYTVDIDDINGCGIVTSNVLTITQPSAIIIDSLISNGISCTGNNDAEIHINASGGTVPYNYSIDDEATYVSNKDFTGLAPGTYYLSLKDANNCIIYIDTLSYINPLPLVAVSESKIDITTCYYDSSGSVNFIVSGGTGPIEYSLDMINWQPSGNFINLHSGSYQVSSKDSNGCVLNSSVLNITAPPVITASITSTPYIDVFHKGTITISGATGGTGILEYSISGTGGPFSSTTFYNALDPATYPVVIRDANSCTLEQNIIVSSLPLLNVTVTIQPATCNGDDNASITLLATNGTGLVEYSIDDSASWSPDGYFDSLTPGTYYLFARDEDSRYFRDTIQLTEPLPISILSNVTRASCSSMSPDGVIDITVVGGTGIKTYLWSNGSVTQDISGIVAGDYMVTVTDQNGCFTNDTITVSGITLVYADAGTDTILCSGEGLILDGKGGTSFSWSPVNGLSNPNIHNPVATITGDISYVLTVVGLNDCVDTDTLNITVREPLDLYAGNDTSILKNQTVSLQATGGPFVSYSWSPVAGLSNPDNSVTSAAPQQTTAYVVTVMDDFGCSKSDTITVKVVERLKIYNAFSPNNDGRNDYWDIDNAEVFPDIIVEVYTRWGEKVFSSKGYSNDKRWDGTIKGKDAPIGTYYYVVIPTKGSSPLTGPLTIVR